VRGQEEERRKSGDGNAKKTFNPKAISHEPYERAAFQRRAAPTWAHGRGCSFRGNLQDSFARRRAGARSSPHL
jgi:hypothetical protein